MTGVGRSAASVLPFLRDEVDLVLLTDARRPPVDTGVPVVALPGFGPLPEPAWLQVSAATWLARHRDHVFHGIYNMVPFASRAPSVVTIHDVAPLEHPEDMGGFVRRNAFGSQLRWAARHADAVITVSRFTRHALIEMCGLPAERTVVIPNGVAPVFGPDRAHDREAADLLARHGIRPPFVVAMGGAPRRGLPVAVEAWRVANGTGLDRPQLVVVGHEAPEPAEGVVHVGRVDDVSWARLLAAAEVFCYPTRYEGFGMPALEAAASGTAVVCAPVASLPEVMGDAAEWADAPEPRPMAAALAQVLGDDARREALVAAGLRRAAAWPGWPEIAALTLGVYRRVAGA